jgi:hypothetical protein
MNPIVVAICAAAPEEVDFILAQIEREDRT